ncbi:MAG: LTA synthase family protein [Eubacterium sp.]|nr:LTA synthase family protein [Eubacterium sp.]
MKFFKQKFPVFKEKVQKFLYKYRYGFLAAIPYFLMDLITRLLGHISYYPVFFPIPNIFTFIWIFLIVGIIINLKGIWEMLAYWFFFFLAMFLYLVNNIYFSMTKFYFSFNLLESTGEGKNYLIDAILDANKLIYICAFVIFVIALVVFIKMRKRTQFHFKKMGKVFLVFFILHLLAPLLYGVKGNELEWNNFKNDRVVYDRFNEPNKSMKVAGLYEYTARSFYIEYLKPEEKISKKDKDFLDSIYTSKDPHQANDYTGIFKGKNVIFLQLEGMDLWALNKEHTPTLYKLMSEGINFKNHYSLYTGGGSTFNSEFAVNIGFTTPISYIENVYNYNSHTFPYTMPRMFKEAGYSVNAFHMNSGEFYSRAINYESWGYDNYYGLIDIQNYKDDSYELDREIIANKTFEQLMFDHKPGEKFVDYIISYTPHTPFTASKGPGKRLANEKYSLKSQIDALTEEDVVYLDVEETDRMVSMMMERLKKRNLLENTVIVAYADHYLYTLADKTILDKYKETSNNLINHTPFFIYCADQEAIQPMDVQEVTMQMDILPTVLNLFGLNYNSNYYLGMDALDPNRKGYAFFSDYSWYNGKSYVESNKVTYGDPMKNNEIKKTSDMINKIIKKNDLTLKFDYFSSLSDK